LTVNHGTHNVDTETACESFVWHDTTYTLSGTYTYAYTNNDGCASVDTLHLTVNHPVHSAITETSCDSFVWHDTVYTATGDYTYSHFDDNGCTQVDTLHLTVNPEYDITVYDTAMRHHEYTFNNMTITPADTGTFTYDFQETTVNGCDSIIHLVLYVQNNDGIEPFELSTVEVFPNPAHNLLNIKGNDIQQIQIYNADGKLVYSTKVATDWCTVDVSNIATGHYFVKVFFDNKQTVTRKVIIQRK
jgi:hypothetical protein